MSNCSLSLKNIKVNGEWKKKNYGKIERERAMRNKGSFHRNIYRAIAFAVFVALPSTNNSSRIWTNGTATDEFLQQISKCVLLNFSEPFIRIKNVECVGNSSINLMDAFLNRLKPKAKRKTSTASFCTNKQK